MLTCGHLELVGLADIPGAYKTCTKCGQAFPATAEYFNRDKNRKDGLYLWCKPCVSEYDHKRYREQGEKTRAMVDAYRQTHMDEIKGRKRAWFQDHKDEVYAKRRAASEERKQQVVEYKHEWHQRNKGRLLSRYLECLRTDPQRRLDHTMAISIGHALRGNKAGRRWERLVGYTLADLKEHLQKQFKPGMTWDNYGKDGWHIDHIRPRAYFRFSSAEEPQFLECWTLDNLQPLWARDNLRKGRRFIAA